MGKVHRLDMSDAAWRWSVPHLPAAEPGSRPRSTSLRAVVDAIFYLLRTGCPRQSLPSCGADDWRRQSWRLLPREHPPKNTVYEASRRCWSDWRAPSAPWRDPD
jgi:putative transposase